MTIAFVAVAALALAGALFRATGLMNERLNAAEDRLAIALDQQEALAQAVLTTNGNGKTLAEQIQAVRDMADNAESAAYDAQSSIDDLARCVNDYMRTVGNARGGRYTYFYC